MCGILYVKSYEVEEAKVKGALELLHHRGPDSTGFVKIENNFFG